MHYLHEYSTFESTEQLNKSIYLHIRNHTHQLNETDRDTLKMIARYAVKYSGAAHLKASTIAEIIGKSEKTARRAINKLAELGIVKKVATFRKINGGKGANILVIEQASESINETVREVVHNNVHKFASDVITEDSTLTTSPDQSIMSSRREGGKATESKLDVREIGQEPSDSINLLKTYLITETQAVPPNALRSSIPSAVYDALAPFFNTDDIYRYYGLLLKAKRKFAPSTLVENDSEPYVEAINSVVFKVKQGSVRNLNGYFYASFAKAATEVARRNTVILSESKEKNETLLSRFSDWLNEESA